MIHIFRAQKRGKFEQTSAVLKNRTRHTWLPKARFESLLTTSLQENQLSPVLLSCQYKVLWTLHVKVYRENWLIIPNSLSRIWKPYLFRFQCQPICMNSTTSFHVAVRHFRAM